jgi:autotransporter-associated beta strand protein
MKLRRFSLFFVALVSTTQAQDIRSATAGNLNTTASWTDGSVPTTADTATWDASSTLTNTLGGNLTWGGINITNASGTVSISGPNNLILDHSTDITTAFETGTNNFNWGASATVGNLHIRGTTPNTSTSQGATFSGSGTVTISSTGTKNWSSEGGTNGVTNVNFTGTLALRGASIPAVGTLPGNWLAFGGGGGAASDNGTLVQTGSFALDTGDSSSCGAFILTHAFSGQSLKLNSLSGTGSIRTDWGLSAGTQTRSIELDQSTDTTLSGSILAHNGNNQRRNINFVKKGNGSLTLTGALGSSATAGGAISSLNFDVQAGTLQLGNGTTNPIYQNAANWDATSTFNVASGATLRFNNSGTFTWNRTLTGGSGDVEIESPDARVNFTTNNSAFSGNIDLIAGSLGMGPNLGSGTLTAQDGTFLLPGLTATPATSTVGALTLGDNTQSDFRLGLTSDKIVVTTTLTPPASGETHTINLFNDPTTGGTITLIDYSGTPLTDSEFARFAIGITPSLGSFELVNNTANTSIDLIVTLEDQIWKGFADENWDTATNNWALASTPAVPAAYNTNNPVLFDDSATRFDVVVEALGINPLSLTFNNSANPYTLTGGDIFGSTSLVKNGTATTTFTLPLAYTGGTTVNAGTLVIDSPANGSSGGTTINAGTLRIGNGGTDGDIGSGPVQIASGASLVYQLDDTQLRDYKTTPKLRNVSGAGTITLDGGLTLFNYTGTTIGFADAGSWTAFSGNLNIIGGSEFRTIRNGSTAMGTATITLGDATTSGNLSQIEGNWTWTNNIQLSGPSNKIINRSAVAPRTLKLQGILSGTGGLTFEDAAASMTNNELGFILTGENTLSGTLTIPTAIPVRVGGVPGNTDVAQSGPGIGGSLGTTTVTNNGTLTFSRSDAHTVSNNISGSGAVFIGLALNNSAQEMTYTGTATHTGGTTVRAGTLTIAPAASIAGPTLTVASDAKIIVNGSSISDSTSLELGATALVETSTNETVATLFIDGIQQPAGTYEATGNPGSNTEIPQLTGTGTLTVTSGPSAATFASWIDSFFPGETDPNIVGPNADPDHDGIPNAVEMVIGNLPNQNLVANLPTLELITDPLDLPAGDYLKFTYRRSELSVDANLTTTAQHDTDLQGPWANATNGIDGVVIQQTEDPTIPGDRIDVFIPRTSPTPLFGRLSVTVP